MKNTTNNDADNLSTHGTDVNQFVSDSCVDHSCITCAFRFRGIMADNGKPKPCPGNWKPASKEQLKNLLDQQDLSPIDKHDVMSILYELEKETIEKPDDTSGGISDEQLTTLKDFMREQIHQAFAELTTGKPSEPSGVAPGYFNPQYINGCPSETMYGNYPGMQRPVFYEGVSYIGNDGIGMEVKPVELRPDKNNYYLDIAEAVAQRGTCLRRKFGAVIVNNDGHIVSTGYVGAPRGRENCCDRGICYRMENKIPSGERYEKCRSVHAEMNAIIQASSEEMRFSTLYLVGLENDGSYTNADCCSMCKRVIINSGINRVVARQSDGTYTETPVISWIVNDDSLDINHVGY